MEISVVLLLLSLLDYAKMLSNSSGWGKMDSSS